MLRAWSSVVCWVGGQERVEDSVLTVPSVSSSSAPKMWQVLSGAQR